jgi:hypothetical protein
MHKRIKVGLLTLALALICGTANSANTQFSCSGDDIEPAALAKSPITVQLAWASPKDVSLDMGKTNAKARITSDNKITLRFHTADFDGEFFKYTNDLFLIYHSGHLAKLSCATK